MKDALLIGGGIVLGGVGVWFIIYMWVIKNWPRG